MIKILLLADTHLGFDLPSRPRTDRRRRGPDFFANTRRALEPALAGVVDLVVHGGDLLFRSKVRSGLVAQALESLLEVADRGVPVVLVPGNHERSALLYPLLAAHQHQTVEGARVEGHTFRAGRDVVRGGDIPAGVAAVLCGHIHRAQALRALHPPSMTVDVRWRVPVPSSGRAPSEARS